MNPPFASAQTRLNSAVFRHLSNAVASIDGGADFLCRFLNPHVDSRVGALAMANAGPEVCVPEASVPAEPVGLPISVNGAGYVIAAAEPDGLGSVTLVLELP